MTFHQILRLVAGAMVLVSLALATWVSPKWLWLTAFVGPTWCSPPSPIGAPHDHPAPPRRARVGLRPSGQQVKG